MLLCTGTANFGSDPILQKNTSLTQGVLLGRERWSVPQSGKKRRFPVGDSVGAKHLSRDYDPKAVLSDHMAVSVLFTYGFLAGDLSKKRFGSEAIWRQGLVDRSEESSK